MKDKAAEMELSDYKLGLLRQEGEILLSQAEIARLEGRALDAERLYEQAIRAAHDNGLFHNEATAYECASAFYRARGFDQFADLYLHNARHCCLRCGADDRVRQLDERYPYLKKKEMEEKNEEEREEERAPSPTRTIGGPVAPLDELQRREARIRRLVDANIVGVAVSDPEGRILEANEAYLDMVGYSREDLSAGRIRWIEMTPLEWQESSLRAFARIHATGSCDLFEKEYFRKDGSRVPVLVGGAKVEDSGSQVISFVLDITDRKRTEEALQRSEAYLAESQRLTHTGSWAFNIVTRKMVYWSEEMFRIWGFDPQQGWPEVETMRQRIHPEDRKTMLELIDKAFGGQMKHDVVQGHRILLPDGTVKHIHGTAYPVFDDNGDVVEFVGTGMDITERKRVEEALQQTQTELAHVSRVTTMGELTSSIAHEINQPLAAIVTNGSACLRWLAAQPPNLEEARQAVERIIQEGHRASQVIGRIRALVKKTPPQKQRLDINEVLLEVIALTRSEVQRHGVSLYTQLSDDLPLILGDRIQLQQVNLNLMINGIEALSAVTERPRELRVCSSRDGSQGVRVAVQDTGIGLDAAHLDHLFDAFYTTKPQGLGMGLAISRSIIEAHGGRLWAMPNAPQGAVLEFTLPVAGERGS